MKKILVTGGAGYIGSHTVVRLFESGYSPIIMDNLSNSEPFILDRINKICGSDIPFLQLDCTQQKSYQQVVDNFGSIDGVIHFAAYKAVGESVEKPAQYYQNNIGSLSQLILNLGKMNCGKLVFSSSCTVYGQPNILPVTEKSPIQHAESPYGYTKQVGEELLLSEAKNKKFQSIALRYFNPIGAHPSGLIGELPKGIPNNLLPYITQTGAGIRKELSIFGNDYNTPDGTCIRDFIHVLDLADAHIRALEYMEEHPETSIDFFNIGTGNGNSVLEMVELFEKVSQQKLSYKIAPRRTGDIEKIWADTSIANNVLGWKAKKSIETAVKDAWNWQKNL
ncbi:MAG: UDP-glucose 4-epimerase GalE [Flavobacteriales bacterium]|jgi:UDP-glucose 4-epimerase|nr:UDP-glucose 4-epimerase GalE [Flavobacteriales bacterium]